MHKKYSKHNKGELPQKSSPPKKKLHVKHKKENECSTIDLKVPQNSKCDIKRLYGDAENKENQKLKHKHNEKHKHRKSESKEREEHHKKHEKHPKHVSNKADHAETQQVENLENQHHSKHKKSARNKHEEKLQKPEKCLENSNKNGNKMQQRSRSFSIESSHVIKHKEKNIRREKTFHVESLKKTKHSKTQMNTEEKETNKTKEKVEKKRKHKQKEPPMEKNTEISQVMYCHVNTQNPFKRNKQSYDVDDLYQANISPKGKEKPSSKTRKSSSKDVYPLYCGEDEGATKEKNSRIDYKQSKEKKHSEAISYSPRKSKKKEHAKNVREQRSSVSLGPYNKYFVFEKKSEAENVKHYHQKRRHRKNKEEYEKIRHESCNNEETMEHRKRSKQRTEGKLAEKKEELREKIEDDLKNYFVKIQGLIDKKLEYILNCSSREDKMDIKAETKDSPYRKEEKRIHRSHSRKEKRTEKQTENGESKRGHKSRALEKQKELKLVDSELKHKRSKTPRKSEKNRSPVQLMVTMIGNEEHQRHQRPKSPKQQGYFNKDQSSDQLITVRNMIGNEEHQRHQRPKSPKQQGYFNKDQNSDQLITVRNIPNPADEEEYRLKSAQRASKSPQPQRDKSPNKRLEQMYARNANDFRVEGIEPAKLLESHHKKSSRRENRAMNLECKTVSIIGIPSQIQAPSTVFSQAQTSTSLNVIEDTVEKKKQSKRFKLYYKYSVADNMCQQSGSGHSSERKSVVSDSYKILSDNSEGRGSDHLDLYDMREEEPTKDSGKVIVMMKKEHFTKNDYDNFNDVGDQRPKKHRKQLTPSDISKLNNIVEESSDVSSQGKMMRPGNDVNCKYFKCLNTSSSDCNLKVTKTSTHSDWNIHSSKYGHLPSAKYNMEKEISTKPRTKSPRPLSPDREMFLREKTDKKVKMVEKRVEQQVKQTTNKLKVDIDLSNYKFRKAPRDFTKKFGSKSDIDISYDSLHMGRSKRVDKGNRDADIRMEAFRPSRDRQPPKILNRKNPRERSNSRKRNKKFADEPLRNVHEESQAIDEKHRNPEAESDAKRCILPKKNITNEVTRIPSSINRRHVDKHSSRLQFPEVSSSQSFKRSQSPPKVVRNCSCQFKELVDVGVEAKLNEEELSPKETIEKKTFPKTAEVAVEAKVIRKHFPIYRKEKVTKPVQKPLPKTSEVAVEADLPYVSKQDRQASSLEKKNLPRHKVHRRSLSPKMRRPVLDRQKSDLVRVKEYRSLENTQNPINKSVTSRPLQKNSEKVSVPSTANTSETNKSETIKYATIPLQKTSKQSNKSEICQEKQVRSASCSEKCRTSAMLRRDDNSIRSSRSALNIREIVPKKCQSEKNSSISLDKFCDNGNPLKTNSQFLEQCTIKSIISDNNHASRLFLTKDFTRDANTYRRRKMYDESIRQRMKKKIQSRPPSQVFEVRYLTLDQTPENTKSEVDINIPNKPNQNRAKLPTFSCNSRSSKNNTRKKNNLKVTPKRSLKNLNRKEPIKESESKLKLTSVSSCRNPYGAVVNDVDQLTRFRKKKFTDNTIEEIFKGRQLNDQSLSNMFSYCKQLADIQSSSLLIKDSSTSFAKQLSGSNSNFKINNEKDNDNFMQLINSLCKSIVTYCNSKIKLPQEDCQDSPRRKKLMEGDDSSDNILKEKEPSADNVKMVHEPEESQEEELAIKTGNESPRSHASCPVLASTPSSFEFLYEEESEYSKETILASLSKPIETILGYALNDNNNTAIIRAQALASIKKKIDQISNSPTDSGESGYSSHSSKKFSSVTNFFKKPNIAALFKPVPMQEAKTSLVRTTPSITDYSLMTQQCQEYAQKVRIQSESKTKLEEPFQEIPLDVLLGKKNENFNSNCSLCRELSNSENEIQNESYHSLNEIRSAESLVQSDNELETLIYYGKNERKPSLEIVKVKRVQTEKSIIDVCHSSSEGLLECEVILSNTNLNTCSLTLIETGRKGSGDNLNTNLFNYEKLAELSKMKHNELRSNFHRSKSNLSNIVSSTFITDSDASDKSNDLLTDSEISIALEKSVSANWFPNLVHDSAEVKKSLAKKFFDNLIQVYDREITVTTQLFQDEDFFVKHLLTSLEDSPKPALGNRGRQKFKHIKGKLKDYIDKVFSPKVGDHSLQEEDAVKDDERFERAHQDNLKVLAYNARRYFSLFVQACRVNKDINDEMKIFGLLKLLERIENGDFAILRKEEDVNFEDEIRDQVKEGFLNVYNVSVKEAKKCKRMLTETDFYLMRAFICKYRIGLLSKTDLIATYIGRGLFKTESQLRAAVTYLIRSQTREIDIKDFEEHCM